MAFNLIYDPYMQYILFWRVLFFKKIMRKNMEKRRFFRMAAAGLGNYLMGYSVRLRGSNDVFILNFTWMLLAVPHQNVVYEYYYQCMSCIATHLNIQFTLIVSLLHTAQIIDIVSFLYCCTSLLHYVHRLENRCGFTSEIVCLY